MERSLYLFHFFNYGSKSIIKMFINKFKNSLLIIRVYFLTIYFGKPKQALEDIVLLKRVKKESQS